MHLSLLNKLLNKLNIICVFNISQLFLIADECSESIPSEQYIN